MRVPNIQHLFNTIRVEQVVAYLTKRNWMVRQNGERIDFERANAEGEIARLFLPAQTSHPKFRRYLPNTIFSLSVMESREAIEVANDIAEALLPSSGPSALDVTVAPTSSMMQLASGPISGPGNDIAQPYTSDSGSTTSGARSSSGAAESGVGDAQHQVIVRNTSSTSIRIATATGEKGAEVPPGSGILVVQKGGSKSKWEVQGDVTITAPVASDIRFLLEPPESGLPLYASTVADWLTAVTVNRVLGSRGAPLSPSTLKTVEQAVRRYKFAASSSNPNAECESALRAGAVLLCELAHALEDTADNRRLTLECCRFALAVAGRTLQAGSDLVDALWQTAVADDPSAPSRLYQKLVSESAKF